jgi:hypothetical protein
LSSTVISTYSDTLISCSLIVCRVMASRRVDPQRLCYIYTMDLSAGQAVEIIAKARKKYFWSICLIIMDCYDRILGHPGIGLKTTRLDQGRLIVRECVFGDPNELPLKTDKLSKPIVVLVSNHLNNCEVCLAKACCRLRSPPSSSTNLFICTLNRLIRLSIYSMYQSVSKNKYHD